MQERGGEGGCICTQVLGKDEMKSNNPYQSNFSKGTPSNDFQYSKVFGTYSRVNDLFDWLFILER